MKNVLFTTTALVALGGMAYADAHAGVALSGSAEMGLTYRDQGGTSDSTTEFHNDIDVTFTLSGATDNGLTFGASIDLDEADGGAAVEDSNSVFIQGSFGTLSMGDVDGAYDKAMIEIAAAGLNDEADQTNGHGGLDGWLGLGDGEILRYDYSFGDLTLSLSAELGVEATGGTGSLDADDISDSDALTLLALAGGITTGDTITTQDTGDVFGVGVGYSTAFGATDLQFGIGYQVSDGSFVINGAAFEADADVIGVSAKAGFGDATVTVAYEDLTADVTGGTTVDLGVETIGVSLEYSFGAAGVGLQYQTQDITAGTAEASTDITGAFVTYDLGGGAEFVAAASQTSPDGGDDDLRAGFGLALSF